MSGETPEGTAAVAAAVEGTRSAGRQRAPEPLAGRILRYYSEAGLDYRAWSADLHMHFGYYRRGLHPLRREPMLAEMTRQVLARLALSAARPSRLVDLGCGVGASARLAARELPAARVDGVTLVPWQVAMARRMATDAGVAERVRVLRADYTATPFPDAAYDGAYAIESACHAAGLGKEDLLREAARLLRPGARLVVADGFLKGERPLARPLGRAVELLCADWALETFAEIGRFRTALGAAGFEAVEVEEISWRIVPSVLHVPWVTARFLAGELRRSRLHLGRTRWGHLRACLLAPFVGLARHRFGYYLVSARRSAAPR